MYIYSARNPFWFLSCSLPPHQVLSFIFTTYRHGSRLGAYVLLYECLKEEPWNTVFIHESVKAQVDCVARQGDLSSMNYTWLYFLGVFNLFYCLHIEFLSSSLLQRPHQVNTWLHISNGTTPWVPWPAEPLCAQQLNRSEIDWFIRLELWYGCGPT